MKKQYIEIDCSGNKFYYKDKKMTKLHREDGPAAEYANGARWWYLNDTRHREDGPAVEFVNGEKWWYLNGKLHREDGPAIEQPSGICVWYLNGVEVTEEEHKRLTQPTIELTLEEIAAKFNIPIDKLRIKD